MPSLGLRLTGRLALLAASMRAAGARVGVDELLGAHRALAAVDPADRSAAYFALRATLCSRHDDFAAFDAALHKNPHLQVQAVREPQYYEGQSRTVTTLITVLGGMVALVMGLGAILAALNTMYSAVAERSREIAVLRALGFGSAAIVISFLSEALWIALIGGIIGCIAVLPVNGITTGTMNWQTFAHLSFAFRITWDLLLLGIAFAMFMGVVGGLPPAIRAARANVATTLRAL